MRRILKCIIFVQITKIYSDISKDVQFTKFWKHYQLWFYRIFLQAPTEEKFYPNFKIIDLQKCIYACIYNIFPPTKSCYQELRHIIEWNGLWQKKIYRFTLINYFKWHDGGPSVQLLQIKYMYTCNYMMYHI